MDRAIKLVAINFVGIAWTDDAGAVGDGVDSRLWTARWTKSTSNAATANSAQQDAISAEHHVAIPVS